MSQQPQICFHQLSYQIANQEPLFTDLTLNLVNKKIGIIGKNGIGKSTLFALITGSIKPTAGSINVAGSYAILPQNTQPFLEKTVAEIFGIAQKLYALKQIENGICDEKYFVELNDDWTLHKRIRQQLKDFALENIDLENKLENFSGGEITKIFLTKLFEKQVDFLLLDEPTNNLDITARKLLYNKISTEKRGIIAISHDRALLEIMDIIIELTPLGVTKYGGNYSFYLEQKQLANAANIRHMNDAKKLLQKTERSIQLTREKRQQRTAAGERLRKSGSQDKMLLDKMQQDATSNQKKICARENAMRQKAQAILEEAKGNIYHSEEFKFDLAHTKLAAKKLVVKLSQIDFAYAGQNIVKGFNLTIVGPERIAIVGTNGSGKSTLVKLIQGELTPQSGTKVIGVSNISYLDQHAGALNPKLSILDNFCLFNPSIKTKEAYHCLAQFLFRNVDALKIVSELSGGEKLRALLACVLMAEKPPELIILDEPTNHLDLESIVALESALQQYQGALIVVSHDVNLLANLKIDRTIFAPFN